MVCDMHNMVESSVLVILEHKSCDKVLLWSKNDRCHMNVPHVGDVFLSLQEIWTFI